MVLGALGSPDEVAASGTHQHRDQRLHTAFSHSFSGLFLKHKVSVSLSHLPWEYFEVFSPCYPIWLRWSDHSLGRNLWGGILEGWWMNCRGNEQESRRGWPCCALLAWHWCVQGFLSVPPPWSPMLFGESSLFCPIHHLWHFTAFCFCPCSRSASSHDREAQAVFFSCSCGRCAALFLSLFHARNVLLLQLNLLHHECITSTSAVTVQLFAPKFFSFPREDLAEVKAGTVL